MFVIIFIMLTFLFAEEKVFVACEGNFYQSNGSIWMIEDGEVYSYQDNPLGEIVQSLYVNDDELYVIVNGTGNIQVFDILPDGLEPTYFIDTEFSGPREMIVVGNYLYFTNWYSADVKKLNLDTWNIDAEIDMPGLPEDIVYKDGLLYVSITMEFDWSDGNEVVAIDPLSDAIVATYAVGSGPGDLIVHDNEIYIARTFYDESWNAFYGTSKIEDSGNVIQAHYGAGSACGGSVHSFGGDVYRMYDGGIAKLDEDLEVVPSTRIGDYGYLNVYAVEVLNDNIYFSLSDYEAPDEVAVVNSQGLEVTRYEVGALPGDFAIWSPCLGDGDMNNDGNVDVVDVVSVVGLIIESQEFDCRADVNQDDIINIVDVVQVVQIVLEAN